MAERYAPNKYRSADGKYALYDEQDYKIVFRSPSLERTIKQAAKLNYGTADNAVEDIIEEIKYFNNWEE